MAKSAVKKAPEMKRSWLVQRLNRPHQSGHSILGKDNPFAFGGGLRNGGLSAEAMDLLRPLFEFDYMGAAEFEFGAVPAALGRIAGFADKGTLEASSFLIDLKDIQPHHREPKDFKVSDEAKTVYVLAHPGWMSEIEGRIRIWADRGYASRLKENTRINEVLRPDPDEERRSWNRTEGWLELDNGFFFFTSEAMWRGVAEIFGVEIP